VLPPLQIVLEVEAIVNEGTVFTVTVDEAVLVQPLTDVPMTD